MCVVEPLACELSVTSVTCRLCGVINSDQTLKLLCFWNLSLNLSRNTSDVPAAATDGPASAASWSSRHRDLLNLHSFDHGETDASVADVSSFSSFRAVNQSNDDSCSDWCLPFTDGSRFP